MKKNKIIKNIIGMRLAARKLENRSYMIEREMRRCLKDEIMRKRFEAGEDMYNPHYLGNKMTYEQKVKFAEEIIGRALNSVRTNCRDEEINSAWDIGEIIIDAVRANCGIIRSY